jgi:hypothetical protein
MKPRNYPQTPHLIDLPFVPLSSPLDQAPRSEGGAVQRVARVYQEGGIWLARMGVDLMTLCLDGAALHLSRLFWGLVLAWISTATAAVTRGVTGALGGRA